MVWHSACARMIFPVETSPNGRRRICDISEAANRNRSTSFLLIITPDRRQRSGSTSHTHQARPSSILPGIYIYISILLTILYYYTVHTCPLVPLSPAPLRFLLASHTYIPLVRLSEHCTFSSWTFPLSPGPQPSTLSRCVWSATPQEPRRRTIDKS